MKVFVTGASGFVGHEIVRQLQAGGHTVRALVRSPRNNDAGLEIRVGNVLDAASLNGALTGCEAVIHLVGIISEVGRNTFENVHTRGTSNITAAVRKAGVKRFIHMSSLGTGPNAATRYHQSKWAAEQIVRQSGLDWTIFRPSIIYGRDDLFTNLFARMSRFTPVMPIMGDGRSKLQPLPVTDVARCFVGALTEPRSIGQTYDLAGGDVLSFEEVLDEILRATGRKRWKIHVSMSLARCQAAVLEFVFGKLLQKAPPLNRDQLIMLSEDNTGNPEPANALFGINPMHFRDGIADYLKN